MLRYYFHVKDGHHSADLEGTEFEDLRAARTAAIELSGEMIREGIGETLWEGIPWEIRVTDAAGGEGREFFRLYFSTRAPA
jgi:hypothetical protein